MYHALIGQVPISEVIVSTRFPSGSGPANQELVGIEIEFVSLMIEKKASPSHQKP